MFARSLRIAVAMGVTLLLASCSVLFGRSIDRPLVYYVRNVTVMADARIPLELIENVDRRVSAAIATTRAPQGAERVVLLVKIDRLGFGEGARRRLAQADFTVTAVSVETGEPVAKGSFRVNGPTDDPRWARQALAEEVAARIRFAFSLTTPRVRKTLPPRTISTRLASEPPPVIVPNVRAAPPRAALVAPQAAPQKPAAPTTQNKVAPPPPREMAAPPVAEVQPPRPAAPAQPARRAADIGKGTPVEQGAVGTIRLRPDCDPAVTADCSASP
ncbi:hypothetical protein QWE_22701 [Agrobacterium albertimagni AOL15]|uniref:Lipoprotein n=1 Tax=Agrobacterium albertimagni AOL15 TaxID=1156935 RepID=K2P8D0_9HYPH|nr:hypothetical protein [Agrobacterium albertimagni]EKF57198.1 hypothetical protein QWE_22701 [Agrobacterium albertimagni AOL15]